MRSRGSLVSKALPLIVIYLQTVNALGKRTFGESCSIGGHITSIFSSEREERTCASDQGLVCVGKCSCPVGRVWESSATVFGKPSDGNDPGCFRAAGTPCFSSSNANCVYNGHCEFGFCICNPGFKAKRGHCIKTSSSEEDTEDSGNKGDRPGSKYPSFADIFNNINNYFQRPQNEGSRFPDARPANSNNDFDLSGFPITRPAHEEFNYPITRPANDEFTFPISRPQPEEYPITRPFLDEESNFYHTRPLHEELQKPYSSSKVLFPDD